MTHKIPACRRPLHINDAESQRADIPLPTFVSQLHIYELEAPPPPGAAAGPGPFARSELGLGWDEKEPALPAEHPAPKTRWAPWGTLRPFLLPCPTLSEPGRLDYVRGFLCILIQRTATACLFHGECRISLHSHTDYSGSPQTVQRGTPFCQPSPWPSDCAPQMVGSVWEAATPPVPSHCKACFCLCRVSYFSLSSQSRLCGWERPFWWDRNERALEWIAVSWP